MPLTNAASVVPSAPTGSVTQHQEEQEQWYHMEPMFTLPSIDSRRMIKTLLLNPQNVKRWDHFFRRHVRVFTIAYFIGGLFRYIGLLAPPSWTGGYVLGLVVFLQLPVVLSVTLSLCYEFLGYMACTFDFWFFGVTNFVGSVGLALAFRDARALLCFSMWFEIENARVIDALCGSNRMPHIVMGSALGAVYYVVLSFAIQVRVVELHSVVLWQTPRGFEVRIEDVVANACLTMGILLARLAYSKRRTLSSSSRMVMIRCSGFRCRLRFVEGPKPQTLVQRTNNSLKEPWRVQLHAVVPDHSFDATRLSGRCNRNPEFVFGGSPWLVRLWQACVIVALGLSLYLVIVMTLMHHDASHGRLPAESTDYGLLCAVFVFQVAALAPTFALYQRKVIQLINSTFDLQFASANGAGVGVGFMVLFQAKPTLCAVAFNVGLWFVFICTLDALSPMTKRVLGISSRRLFAVVLLLLGIQGFMALDLAIFGYWNIPDRAMVEFALPWGDDPRVRVSAIVFTLSRVITHSVWMLQVLWRLWFCDSAYNNVVLLQGSAQYESRRARGRELGGLRVVVAPSSVSSRDT